MSTKLYHKYLTSICRAKPLRLSRTTTGDAVTITIDDRIVDSRFRGNDEIRGGLRVFAGGHRDPPLRLRPGTRSYDVGRWLGSGEDLWFEILLFDDAGAALGGPYYEQTLFFGKDRRFLFSFQPSHRPIDRSPLVTITGRELPQPVQKILDIVYSQGRPDFDHHNFLAVRRHNVKFMPAHSFQMGGSVFNMDSLLVQERH